MGVARSTCNRIEMAPCYVALWMEEDTVHQATFTGRRQVEAFNLVVGQDSRLLIH